jgi:hypothetical protein
MAAPDTAHLRPDKIAVWPVEGDRYGIDLSYAGATGYTRADQAHQTINANGMNATFRQELGDMWTVRLGPLARDAMVLVWSATHSRSRAPSSDGGSEHGRADARDDRSPSPMRKQRTRRQHRPSSS